MNKITLQDLALASFLYGYVADDDKPYKELHDKTGGYVDLDKSRHIHYLLNWLRKWGCRSLAKDRDREIIKNILSWWRNHREKFPDKDSLLWKMKEHEFDFLNLVYKNLTNTIEKIGPTTASKILFALRPNIFLPWDGAIRSKYKRQGNSDEYIEFLKSIQAILIELDKECRSKGFVLEALPEKIERDGSSVIKLVDEYNFITISKRHPIPDPKFSRLISNWYQIEITNQS